MLVYHKYIQIPNSYCSCSCTEVANSLAEAHLFWVEQMPTPFCVASYSHSHMGDRQESWNPSERNMNEKDVLILPSGYLA